MHKNFLSILRIATGVALLLFGIIGLVVPVLQGWLLIILAIPLISPEHGKKMVEQLKKWKNAWRSKAKNQN